MNPLEQIRTEIAHLARAYDIPDDELPTFGRSDGNGRPHIEAEPGRYHYVHAERGSENDRFTTQSKEELFYRVFADATSVMSIDHAQKHRGWGDFRRPMFRHQLDLLRRMRPDWADRRAREIEETLAEHPYKDF
jgi:hypothetical protein